VNTGPDALPGVALMGLAALMAQVFAGADLSPLAQAFIDRATRDPSDAAALLDLSTALYLADNPDLARSMQEQALAVRRLYTLARRTDSPDPPGLRVLTLMAPGKLSANTPLDFLIDDFDVALDFYYLAREPAPLPPFDDYDLVFVAVGESDANAPLLRSAEALLANCPRPVLNAPGHIARLSRDRVFATLRGAPGIVVPATERVDRHALEALGARDPVTRADPGFPMVVRPIGSHAGRGLAKLEAPADIPEYLRTAPGDEFYVMLFVDYRGADGLFRKYRVVLIGGRPYACHMAISDHWMIHYLNAGMGESAAKRAEEAHFFARFEEDFARRHRDALRVLDEGVALDYFGIDCAETAAGELLIFEVDSALIVHALDPVDLYPYKPAQMRKVFAAFRALLDVG
jgi:glutathione synthase/RimK-type ligase-like ATP-grasp enzyme